MPSKLPTVPFNTPLIGADGLVNPLWKDWFHKADIRMGGRSAYRNDELGNVSTEMIEDSAVTAAKIAASVAGDGLNGGSGSALSVNTDGSTIEIVSDQLRVKDTGITAAKLAGSIPYAKLLATDWTNSAAASGYTKLPNGIYFQWGVTASIASAGSSGVTFPVAFPTGCLQVIVSIKDNSAVLTTATGQVGSGNYSASSFSVYNRTSVAQVVNWFAVGY